MTQFAERDNVDGTSPAPPKEWIERLFIRFRSIYGNKAETMWGKADQTDLLQTWADEITGYTGADIRDALDTMRTAHPDYPPTLYEFAALCRDARTRRTGSSTYLPAPRTRWEDIDERIRDEIAKYRDPKRKRNPKDWAREILALAEAGRYTQLYGIDCAKDALGLRH